MEINKKIAIFITIFTVVLLAGLTYTYFAVSVSNENNEKVQTQTATMSLEFDDGDNGISANLNLGESIVKKFTLENTGTVDAYAKINWYNLVNTYTSNSLTWTLEQSTSENGTYTSVGSGKVPTSSTATTAVLKNGLLVPVNTTYYYKLTITLNNLDINQSSDINANMHSKFNLQPGTLSVADKIMNLVAGEPSNTTDVITKDAPEGATCTNTLAYDGTVDNNLRYVGANPCNYVTFNGKTAGWRIVGIMNNVDDGAGKKETRIKLVRNDSLGNYSWDSSESSVHYGYGVNDWTQADLMQELNGDYLDTTLTTNTIWYNGSSNQKTAEYDYTKGLKAVAQSQIGNAKWHLGGTDWNTYSQDATGAANNFYNYERGTTVWGSSTGQTCNDGACPRATEWTGKVALIYPSDYGYAVGGEVRSTCLSKSLYKYNTGNCGTNDYLRPAGGWSWALSPRNSSGIAFTVGYSGMLNGNDTSDGGAVRPAVYLKSEVSISSGNGSESEPYQIN